MGAEFRRQVGRLHAEKRAAAEAQVQARAVGLQDLDVRVGNLLVNPLVVTVVKHSDIAVVTDEDHAAAHALVAVFAVGALDELLHLDLADFLLFTVVSGDRRHNRQRQRDSQPELHSRHRSILLLSAFLHILRRPPRRRAAL